MTEAIPDAASPEVLAKIDASYRPFPGFADWIVLSIDTELWDRRTAALAKSRENAPKDAADRALQAAIRAAAIDTGAIEGLYPPDRGFTIAVATQAALWEAQLQAQPPQTRNFIEAQVAAYKLALGVATKRRPVTEVFIRHLQEQLTSPQETYRVFTSAGVQHHEVLRGKYKEHPNHVRLRDGSFHAYAPVEETRAEMHRLVFETSTDDFSNAHPVLQASYIHYALTVVHPFADGNGRVARVLASIYLCRASSIPFVVTEDQRDLYFDQLEAAGRGQYQGFVEFCFDRAIDTLQLVSDQLGPSPDDQIPTLIEVVTAQSGMTHQQIEQLGATLMQLLHEVLQAEQGRLQLPPGVGISFAWGLTMAPPARDDFRELLTASGQRGLVATATSNPPAQAQVQVNFHLLIAKNRDQRYPFVSSGYPRARNSRFVYRISFPEHQPDFRFAYEVGRGAFSERCLPTSLGEPKVH